MHVGMGTGFAHQRGENYPDALLMREEFENCVLAEELGFDSVWITEHHFSDYSICTDPVQALTYLAGRTRRIRLGTQVIVVPWHHPVRLAERIIMLDHVSNGRAILGFGRGLARHEYQGLGVDQSRSRQLYDEILKIVIPALETGWIDPEGTSFTFKRSELRPRPLRSFEGRKFCGSLSEGSLRTAAEMGFGQIILTLPQRGQAPDTSAYDRAWEEVHGPGTHPTRPAISGQYVVDDSAERAFEVGSRYTAHTMRAAVTNYELDDPTLAEIPGYEGYAKRIVPKDKVDEWANEYGKTVVAGTPQQVLERMWDLKESLGGQAFFPHLYFGSMPQEEAVRNMRMFAKTVLPEVKSWAAQSSLDDSYVRMAA